MEFITLTDVLVSIAENVEYPYHNQKTLAYIGKISEQATHTFWAVHDEKIEWARRMSYAAQILNQALHDLPDSQQLQWMEFDEAKRFAVRANVRQEGIDMLTHATGWGSRELKNCCDHFRNAITQGDDALAMPVFRKPDDGLTIDGGFLRFAHIGFDRTALVSILNQYGINHTLGGSSGSKKKPATVTGGDTYNLREKSFNAWLENSRVNITALKVKAIFEQVKVHYKQDKQVVAHTDGQTDEELWNISLGSFRTEFWGRYADTHRIKKKAGRPSKVKLQRN
ncbi:hypothetical protein KFZ76_08050 [Methylovulum psychrotolerans]|uniref:hypothetical protein n=1 Tax=Methylovulum psychrotolerans TaxID=1704499 RepID=UPI001BFF3207|nr:hypothetical protein [Methylovulum psychrotolerans]MBT9097658.1 hypothetical protein [Methylovulum psychrotolerans]